MTTTTQPAELPALSDEQIDEIVYQTTGFDGCGTQEMNSFDMRRVFRAALAATGAQAVQSPAEGHWIRADDVNRLVRELDVALNGEAGAARQASLCDLVAQVKAANVQPKGTEAKAIGYMNAGQLLELSRGGTPYGYVYPEEGPGAHTPVYVAPQAPAPAQCTPALKRHALEAADRLAMYAAAPFFPDTEKRGVKRATTAEWWDGLAELIEEAQPLIKRGLHECTAPLADLQAPAVAEQPWQAMLYAPRDGSKIELLVEHREYWIALKAGRADGYRQACEGHWVDFNGGGWSWMGTAGQPIGWRPLRTGPVSDVPVQGSGS